MKNYIALPVTADLLFMFFSHLSSIVEDVVDITWTRGDVGGAKEKLRKRSINYVCNINLPH